VGIPAEDDAAVGGLAPERIHPLRFGSEALPFAVPGMSDVMPYPSTRFSDFDPPTTSTYLDAWRAHLADVVDRAKPDLIHSHHVWLMSSILKDVAPDISVVTHCHATGLRQLELCPQLAPRVRDGCRRIDRFCVLHQGHAHALVSALGVNLDRVHQVGAGFRDDLFHGRHREPANPPRLLYVGKFAAAKGLPWLLDACETLRREGVEFELQVAGGGAGPEADLLRKRMATLAPFVTLNGQLSQPELAKLMRRCDVCVLPSMYEGLPLVLVEAFACGCRLVATALQGVVDNLAPALGDALDLVQPPTMEGIDTPVAEEVPEFTARLAAAISRSLDAEPLGDPAITRPRAVAEFTWEAVFKRVEATWLDLLGPAGRPGL
jgi:glycosyltransferase involved in cell wall biosynthesis